MRRLTDRFLDAADWVSYAIGTPANIGFWIVVVVAWIAAGPYMANHNFLPAWFTSNGFNFPLNTVTTLAELYIGFLLAAAANRAQRKLEEVLARIQAETDEIDQLLKQNTELTRQVHTLTEEVRRRLGGVK